MDDWQSPSSFQGQFYRVLIGQAWWLILAVPTLGRLRLGGHKFKNSLGYIMRLSPKHSD